MRMYCNECRRSTLWNKTANGNANCSICGRRVRAETLDNAKRIVFMTSDKHRKAEATRKAVDQALEPFRNLLGVKTSSKPAKCIHCKQPGIQHDRRNPSQRKDCVNFDLAMSEADEISYEDLIAGAEFFDQQHG